MTEIDRKGLWGLFDDQQKKSKDLALKIAHKAVNIPYDDPMNVKTTNTVNGMGAKGLIGVALAAVLPVAALAGLMLWNQQQVKLPAPSSPISTQSVTQPQPTQPVNNQLDSEWDEVLFTPGENGQPEKILSRTRYRSRSGVVEKKLPDGTWQKVG